MPPAHRFGEARTGNHGLERANMRYTKAEANEMRWEEREGHKRQVIQDAFENFLALEDGKNQYFQVQNACRRFLCKGKTSHTRLLSLHITIEQKHINGERAVIISRDLKA